MLWAIPIAILSARLYYVIFEWGYYSQHPGQILQIWNGGIAIHGALIGSVLTAYVFAKKRGHLFLEDCRYCRTKYYFRPSYRTLGEFHEPGGTWRRSH